VRHATIKVDIGRGEGARDQPPTGPSQTATQVTLQTPRAACLPPGHRRSAALAAVCIRGQEKSEHSGATRVMAIKATDLGAMAMTGSC
jgi:hypothetical protein